MCTQLGDECHKCVLVDMACYTSKIPTIINFLDKKIREKMFDII